MGASGALMKLFASGEIIKEYEKLLDVLPKEVNSPKELDEYLKAIGKVRLSAVKLGIYSGKRIKYKE